MANGEENTQRGLCEACVPSTPFLGFTVNCMSSTIGQGDREGAVGMQMQSCESVTWHKERAGLIGGRPVSYARETITGCYCKTAAGQTATNSWAFGLLHRRDNEQDSETALEHEHKSTHRTVRRGQGVDQGPSVRARACA